MATITHGASSASSTDGTSYTILDSIFTPAANDLLVLAVVKSDSVNDGTVTDSLGDGGGWIFLGSVLYHLSANLVEWFIRDKLVSATAMTITYDCTGDATTGCLLAVTRAAGMTKLGAAAVRQSATQANQAPNDTPAPVFPAACLTDNPTLGLIGNRDNPAGMTAPTDWTEQVDIGYATPGTGLEYVSRDSGFSGTTITWGSASLSRFASFALELDASGVEGHERLVGRSISRGIWRV